ncbi:hypothetical protein TRFO_15557 [Tritrichomonas foetus]|uniref:Protein kinase domain-containing protein n=1 Tax=Tritrichomonas foetus TaxID=1144522 RepID=A0A1J4KWD5_9EUKA|nr:hypothetical protein TRFO_15557 [Tritrichomonas foetus]|eukprot:OHT14060.1 hypothetical protein TRFO_15557 [Tritrichomonas foetus]
MSKAQYTVFYLNKTSNGSGGVEFDYFYRTNYKGDEGIIIRKKYNYTSNSKSEIMKKYLDSETVDPIMRLPYHPNITKLFYVDRHKKVAYLDYVPGYSLSQYVKNHIASEIELDKKLIICHSLAKGIQFLHNHQIYHRDISSCNVIITPSSVSVIIDLEFMKHTPQEISNNNTYTGKLAYLHPDFKNDSLSDLKKIDIFAYSIVLYELFLFEASLDFTKHNSMPEARDHFQEEIKSLDKCKTKEETESLLKVAYARYLQNIGIDEKKVANQFYDGKKIDSTVAQKLTQFIFGCTCYDYTNMDQIIQELESFTGYPKFTEYLQQINQTERRYEQEQLVHGSLENLTIGCPVM